MSARPTPLARQAAWAALALGLLGGAAHAATVQVTVLASDGKPLPNAVVILEPTTSGERAKAPPPTDLVITQEKMQFVPALSVVPAGSRVTFTNLDELRLDGKAEDKPAASSTVTLDRPGPMQLGCHLHGSMRGSLYVTDTPWAVKTNADGVATLPDVPEGAARVRIWHVDQLIDAAPTPLTVTTVTAVNVETRIQPRKRRP